MKTNRRNFLKIVGMSSILIGSPPEIKPLARVNETTYYAVSDLEIIIYLSSDIESNIR